MEGVIKRIRNRHALSPWLFLLPALVCFALFKYYPIILGFFVSFFKMDIVNPPGEFIGLGNYIRAFSDSAFLSAIRNNVEFFLVTIILAFWVPILLAILINEVRKGKTLARLLYFIPAIAPGIAIAVLWKYIWQPDYGFANFLTGLFGLEPQLWLNDPRLVKWCMQFPGLVMGGGMSMVIYLAAFQDIPEEQYESALIDGAGFWKRIRYIALPQISSIVGIMFILTLIDVFNMFDAPQVMTGGGPSGASETMILYAFKVAYRDMDYSYGITLSNIAFIIVFIFTAIQLSLSGRKDRKGG